MKLRTTLFVLASLLLTAAGLHAQQQKAVLFDAMHAQTAGNADWVLDEDTCGTAQRFPTPDQSNITPSTPETFWSGAFSAMGIDLVKKGFRVESLPIGSRVTFGDASNPQDLSNYAVYVIPEPNIRFSTAEITAILAYVRNGGGLFLIADHAGADRNNDGFDAPRIFNQMAGSPSVFGITFNGNKNDRTLGWFNDQPGRFTADATSPIVGAGAFGTPSPSRGLGLFGSTSMTLSGNAKGHIWRTTSTPDTPTGVTFATSTFGSGRVAAVGDSSPSEDETNNCNHNTHPGYTATQFDNALIFANAVAWLASGAPVIVDVPNPPDTPAGTGIDIGGWTITQANATNRFTIPAGTIIPANGYVVIGRKATKAAFEAFWGEPLGGDVVYLNANGAFPQINGGERYTLRNAGGTVVDGPTIAMPSSAGRNVKRNDPCLAAGAASSWTVSATTNATPGSSSAAGCAKGVVINEFSDASSSFTFEFIELHNDQ